MRSPHTQPGSGSSPKPNLGLDRPRAPSAAAFDSALRCGNLSFPVDTGDLWTNRQGSGRSFALLDARRAFRPALAGTMGPACNPRSSDLLQRVHIESSLEAVSRHAW